MSQGHRWAGSAGQTQNQGNILGDRPCVRQSRHYRQHLGGNAVKEMLGQDSLKWTIDEQQGAYKGMRTWNDSRQPTVAPAQQMQQRQALQQNQQPNQFQNNQQQMQQQQPSTSMQCQPQQQQQQMQQPNMMMNNNNFVNQQQQQPPQQQQQQQQQQNQQPIYDGRATNVRCTGRSNQQTFSIFGH